MIFSLALLLAAAAAQSSFTVSNATFDGALRRPVNARLVWHDEFDGSALERIRVSFPDRAMASREIVPLSDAGVEVLYLGASGEWEVSGRWGSSARHGRGATFRRGRQSPLALCETSGSRPRP